jgi:hypothetical protein
MISTDLWPRFLRLVPTRGLQAALASREGVRSEFVVSGETRTYSVTGVCWVTINED